MKKIFKKVFSRTVIEPFVTLVSSILILEYIIFPGLTIDSTFTNIGAGLIAFIMTIFILTYIDNKIRDKFEKKEDKPNQEPTKENKDGKI